MNHPQIAQPTCWPDTLEMPTGRLLRLRIAIEHARMILLAAPSIGGQMKALAQMKAKVEAAIRKVDPEAVTGTFYDDASDRLFVTIIKGPRKVSATLRGRDFLNGDSETISRAVEDGLRRLKSTPIG